MQGNNALHYAYRSSSTDVIFHLEHLDANLKDIKNDVRIVIMIHWILTGDGVFQFAGSFLFAVTLDAYSVCVCVTL